MVGDLRRCFCWERRDGDWQASSLRDEVCGRGATKVVRMHRARISNTSSKISTLTDLKGGGKRQGSFGGPVRNPSEEGGLSRAPFPESKSII